MSARAVRRLFVGLLTLLAILDAVILFIRLHDVVTLGRLVLVGIEGPPVYAIWKIRHGYPLYEWPTKPFFSLTLYNFAFYKTYAAVFDALRVPDASMPIVGRFITAAFAALGAVGQFLAIRRFAVAAGSANADSKASAYLRDVGTALLAVAAWFGCGLPQGWTLQIRPDVPAAAIATWAIVCFGRGVHGEDSHGMHARHGLIWLIAAGLLFFCAWSFKQSQVALFGAACIYTLVWRRSRRELLALASPFLAGVAITMDVGGAVYRANIISAPSVNPLIPYLTVYFYRTVFLTDLLLWGVPAYAIVAILRPGSSRGPVRSLGDIPARSRAMFGVDLTFPLIAVLMTFASGAILLAKVGSNLNHLLELNVAASLLCGVMFAAAWDTALIRRLCVAGALLLLPMVAFDLALLQNDASRLAMALQLKGWGTGLHFTSREIAADKERLAAIIRTLPQPVYVEDQALAQPVYSNGGRYPVVILDHVFYDAAFGKGLVGRGVEGLFGDRYFASAVIPDSSAFLAVAMRAGYRLVSTFTPASGEPLRIIVRPE